MRKLQALLKMEFAERIIDQDPEDLKEGDHGLESRAPRRAQKAAPSDGYEAAASSKHKPRRKAGKRKAISQPEDEDDEPEDEDDEEWAVDELLGRKLVSDEDFKIAASSRAPCSTSPR